MVSSLATAAFLATLAELKAVEPLFDSEAIVFIIYIPHQETKKDAEQILKMKTCYIHQKCDEK